MGDLHEACYRALECSVDCDCPGNLQCFNGRCGCSSGFQRKLDYCVAHELSCTSSSRCPTHQECVYTSPGHGFCVCPQGFRLLPNGECQDINECLEGPAQCAANATCVNLLGFCDSYQCRCLEGYTGDPYRDGCVAPPPPRRGCQADDECPLDRKCEILTGACYDPCSAEPDLEPELRHHCGLNAVCAVDNHIPQCACPVGYEGDPAKLCLKRVMCGIDYHCPGNLLCLDSHTCGCPPNYFRDQDYCFLKITNCTTTTPCGLNEDCVFTGDQGGFCVCPHGYELVPSTGQCRDIDECGGAGPCATGAQCRNKPGSYECLCPPETIGDPYLKGCQGIDGCRSNDDCANDRECDLGSKQCISPCYICGPIVECTARDHKAICTCPPGKVGDPYDKDFGCYDERHDPVESRTIPPAQDLTVQCLADGVQVSIQLGGFDGTIYVKGHSQDAVCRRQVTSHEDDVIDFKVNFGHCGLIHDDRGEAGFVLVIQKHPRLVTYRARAYHIKCVYQTGERTISLGFNVSMITTSGTIANTGPPPTCIMSIAAADGTEISSAEIGDDLILKVDVQPDFIYGGYARSCVAKTMEDDGEYQYEVTDDNGCATDPTIFGNWDYDPHSKQLSARFNAFKFPSSNNLRFQCNIRVCFGSCPPVNCDGQDAYGRRRRRSVDYEPSGSTELQRLRRSPNNEHLDELIDAYKEGALREEIMVQSNAILTFERREPPASLADDTSHLRVDEIDHVCLPKFGLILSIIITTLLALVAVAVAISCWLMAYRRQTKRAAPLPHPPEFPNPLYTTPEPLAEPTPDYNHGPVMQPTAGAAIPQHPSHMTRSEFNAQQFHHPAQHHPSHYGSEHRLM